jgi:hypothetical protein
MMAFNVEGVGEDARFFIRQEDARLTVTYGSEHIEPAKRINRYRRRDWPGTLRDRPALSRSHFTNKLRLTRAIYPPIHRIAHSTFGQSDLFQV